LRSVLEAAISGCLHLLQVRTPPAAGRTFPTPTMGNAETVCVGTGDWDVYFDATDTIIGPRVARRRSTRPRPSLCPYSPNYLEKMNSPKFVVASVPSSLATNAPPRPGGTPSAPKRGSYVPFVAPLCIKLLRLVTMQLPENSGPLERDSIKLRLHGLLRSSLAGYQKVVARKRFDNI
jgi:hypothetical protein